jgi:hypothetical protein
MRAASVRPRAVALALLAFPPALRSSEVAGLALDLGARSGRRFGRELAGLVAGGLRARSARAAAVPVPRLVADGLCLAATWTLTLDLATLGAQRMRGMSGPLLAWPSLALLTVVLGLALVGLDRVAGVGALVWTAARMPDLLAAHANPAVELLPALCFAALVLTPRERALDPRRLAWLLVPVVLIATFGPPPAEQSVLALALVATAIGLSAGYAMVDPRIAIAGALPLAYLTSGHAPQAALIIAAAASVRVAVVRRAHAV